MPVLKCVTKFLYANAGNGVGSWSENFYYNGEIAAAQSAMLTVNGWRLKLSGPAVSILSQNVVDLATPGIGYPLGTGVNPLPFSPSNSANDNDQPQVALAFKIRASNNSKRTLLVKGIPDNIILNGRFTPHGNYLLNVDNYCQAIVNSGFCLRTVDKTQTPVDLVGVSSSGVLTMPTDRTWDVGNKIQLYRCTDANKQGVVGQFTIVTKTDARTFTLGQWGSRPAVVRGKVRLLLFSYPQIVAIGNRPKSTVGKIGAPSSPYVGRRKKGR